MKAMDDVGNFVFIRFLKKMSTASPDVSFTPRFAIYSENPPRRQLQHCVN